MPLLTSMKLNRAELRKLASALPRETLMSYSLNATEHIEPVTETERKLRDIWAQVLSMDPTQIGRNDRFLAIGGDSITAIQLVTLARAAGVGLSVAQIFADSRLEAVAAIIDSSNGDGEQSYKTEPFEMVPVEEAEALKVAVAKRCGLHGDETLIEDIYPCTPLQQGLVALSLKSPGSYIARKAYRLPASLDLERFKAAWERTLDVCTNLRTRIVVHNGETYQVVVRQQSIPWESLDANDLGNALTSSGNNMRYGSALCRWAFVSNGTERYFVLTLHHAVFDGWSLGLMHGTLRAIYNTGDRVTGFAPYANFVKYTTYVDHEAAAAYWTKQLSGAQRASFPTQSMTSSTSSSPTPSVTRVMTATIPLPAVSASISATPATLLRAAWGIVLSRYCDADSDIVFGTTVSGRQAPVPGVESMPGPVVATVPVRLHLANHQQTIASFLQAVQAQGAETVTYEQFGLRNISHLTPEIRDMCDFSSLLIIHPGAEQDDEGVLLPLDKKAAEAVAQTGLGGYFSYPLVLEAIAYTDEVGLVFTYGCEAVGAERLEGMARHLENVLGQLAAASDDATVGDISVAGHWDLEQSKRRNETAPARVDACVHELFAQQIAQVPSDQEAVYAWDGSLTYRKLDRLSTTLAATLVQEFTVGPEELVPICFQKSMWAIVAMLAVLKAGGAFVPLDPGYPRGRRQALVQETRARLILASSEMRASCQGLTEHVLEVSPASVSRLHHRPLPPSRSTPSSAAYAIFTSGSTGRPKTIVVEHAALSTSIVYNGRWHRMGVASRVLQYSAFIFDISLGEIFETLAHGGTICIPSESQRMNIAPFFAEAQANVVMLTASFLATLKPTDLPSVKLLLLVGEVPTKLVIQSWHGHAKVVNAYGPAEAVVYCASHTYTSRLDAAGSIGRPTTGVFWVVDPDNHQRLAPIGCIGELLIQGHALARGYANDADLTSRSFMNTVSWAHDAADQTFYKTGDLVRYNADGSLEYLGRKDTQIKVRGQRIELGAIEHAIKSSRSDIAHAAVDVVRGSLVALVQFVRPDSSDQPSDGDDTILPATPSRQDIFSTIAGDIAQHLPAYMLPSFFVAVSHMPLQTSMKLHRSRLRQLIHTLTPESLQSFSLVAQSTKVSPVTGNELKLQAIWSEVLDLPASNIGQNGSFLNLGGDSIIAIPVVTLLHEKFNLALTVQDLFADPRLKAVAAKITGDNQGRSFEVQPFDLLAPDQAERIRAVAAMECRIRGEQVADVYPATSLQEGLMALSVKQPGSYVAIQVYKLRDDVDMTRFGLAWEKTVESCDLLRTRIVLHDSSSVQVVVKEPMEWASDGQDLATVLRTAAQTPLGYGTRLAQFALTSPDERGSKYFVLVIHHAVFDGWSMGLLLDALHNSYAGNSVVPAFMPYSGFVNYTKQIDSAAAEEYWRAQLEGAQTASFPSTEDTVGPDALEGSTHRVLSTSIDFSHDTNSSFTAATFVKAAWALVLARYSDTSDITFGTTVSGRHAPVSGIDRIAGPTISTVPLRLRLEQGCSANDFLTRVQTQASEMIPFEQLGLQSMSKLSAEAKAACDFGSLILVQPGQAEASGVDSTLLLPVDFANPETADSYFNYPLVLQALTHRDRVELVFTYNNRHITASRMDALAHHLENVVRQLLAATSSTLVEDISIAGSWDLGLARCWNRADTTPARKCLHHMIAKQAAATPSHEAIEAWDGSLTYTELDHVSKVVAAHLATLGVGAGALVPVSFEKSLWAIVAMLGVLKSGAAFVPIDPDHPVSRRQQLVQQANARVMVVSGAVSASCSGMVEHLVELSPRTIAQLSKLGGSYSSTLPSAVVDPANTAYAIHTSGSTGTPKTITVSHTAITTSLLAIFRDCHLSPATRTLQFSNFVFDVSLAEIFATLISGGTLCIPSDGERLGDLAGFIKDNYVTAAFLTPSVARLFGPDDTPTLNTLVLGGEAPTRQNLETWFGRARLINGYGPAEAVVYAAMHVYQSKDERPGTIGGGLSADCYVADAEDAQRLAPVGCVGELIVHGHSVASGYANNPEHTSRVFLKSMGWLPATEDGRMFYLTGDLVRYRFDGTMEFLGRKDAQVKLRGQRVELEAIEHGIKMAQAAVLHVAVNKVAHGSREWLVAMINFDHVQSPAGEEAEGEQERAFVPMTKALRKTMAAIAESLRASLPGYMVPTFFVPLYRMPFQASMKLHRAKLQEMASELSHEELLKYSLADPEKTGVSTEMEARVRDVWARVLGLDAQAIGRRDNFLQIGGDSITAIQVVTAAREAGISLTVQDIFADARLTAVASRATTGQPHVSYDAAPFTLIASDKLEAVKATVMNICRIGQEEGIQDIYPCTSLQEGLMALAVKQPGSYMGKYVYRLSKSMDETRFRAAWDRTVQACESLRTRIVLCNGESYQAVTREAPGWETTQDTLDAALEATKSLHMSYGSPLCRYSLITDETSGARYFLLVIHHAVFDGWSLGLVMETLRDFYEGGIAPALQPYAGFVKYVSQLSISAAETYWKTQLEGARRASFPRINHNSRLSSSSNPLTRVMESTIPFPALSDTSITRATILRGVWAMVLARYSSDDTNNNYNANGGSGGCDDITFGTAVSGRQSPVPGVERMAGPTVATVPVRVRLDKSKPVAEFLRELQAQASEMVPFEQFGLRNIARLGADAKEACDFRSLMVVQPAPVDAEEKAGAAKEDKEDEGESLIPVRRDAEGLQADMEGYFNYPLVVQCVLYRNRVKVSMTYDAAVLTEVQLRGVLSRFEHLLPQLVEKAGRKKKGEGKGKGKGKEKDGARRD